MQSVLTVCRIIVFIIRLILWVLLMPFIIVISCIRIANSRFRFRRQLIKSGISEEWADKLSRRYSIRMKDISEMIKLSKNKQLKFLN